MAEAIVVDHGSSKWRVGESGEERPKSIFPTVVGVGFVGGATKTYIGDEALSSPLLPALQYKYPIEQGLIRDWEAMEVLWEHNFKEMNVDPQEIQVLLSESTFSSRAQREQETELLFETFQIPYFCVMNEAVLGIYAMGRVTGLVVDMGYSMTQIVPILEGYVLPHAVVKMDVGGRHLTQFLAEMLRDRPGGSLSRGVVEEVKEKLCYVALDFEGEVERLGGSARKSYGLPGGGTLEMGEEMVRCPEGLFRPGLLERGGKGLPGRVQEVIEMCGEELHKDLYGNVVISGGCSLFPGLHERFQKELLPLAPPGIKVKVLDYNLKDLLVWVGGSIYSSLPNCFGPSKWTTKDEYHECGPPVIHKKCFY